MKFIKTASGSYVNQKHVKELFIELHDNLPLLWFVSARLTDGSTRVIEAMQDNFEAREYLAI